MVAPITPAVDRAARARLLQLARMRYPVSRPRPPRAMASPPTVTSSTGVSGALLVDAAIPRVVPSLNIDGFWSASTVIEGGPFTWSRGVWQGVNWRGVSEGSAATQTGGLQQASFVHDGAVLAIWMAQTATEFMVKVDDEFVSLTPVATGSTSGSSTFYKLDFGVRALRRIDVIGAKSVFRGVFIEQSATVLPAPRRGPRVICVGDSFTQSDTLSWPVWMGEALGWDDTWAAGVGGTGWINNAGTKRKFGDRIDADVLGYAPDIVWFYGSGNDNASTPAQVATEAAAVLARVRSALPDALIVGGFTGSGGVERASATECANTLNIAAALRDTFRASGHLWLSPVDMPVGFGGQAAPTTTTIIAHAAGRAGNTGSVTVSDASTGLRCNANLANPTNIRVGATVEVGTGANVERFVVTGRTQISGAQLSYAFDGTLRYAHVVNETVREVGPSYLTGTGRVGTTTGRGNADLYVSSDGVHPAPAGVRALGMANAVLLARALSESGLANLD